MLEQISELAVQKMEMLDECHINVFIRQMILLNILQISDVPGVEKCYPIEGNYISVIEDFFGIIRGIAVTHVDGFHPDIIDFKVDWRSLYRVCSNDPLAEAWELACCLRGGNENGIRTGLQVLPYHGCAEMVAVGVGGKDQVHVIERGLGFDKQIPDVGRKCISRRESFEESVYEHFPVSGSDEETGIANECHLYPVEGRSV